LTENDWKTTVMHPDSTFHFSAEVRTAFMKSASMVLLKREFLADMAAGITDHIWKIGEIIMMLVVPESNNA